MSDDRHAPLDPDLAHLVPDYLAARRADLEALRDHLDAGQFDAIQALGHQLRGSGGTYGFDTLSQLGGALEVAGKTRDAGAVARMQARLAKWLNDRS